jgi:hypothetical protein
MSPDAAQVLAEQVSCAAGYKPFGEMTIADVERRANELAEAAAVTAMAQRIAPVAAAWRGLAEEMARTGAGTVGELDRDGLLERAGRLWIVPPGGSLLGG